MSSITPLYLPPPPPGYQLVYVPPPATTHTNHHCSPRHPPTSQISFPPAGPSTPARTPPPLPTPSDTPMSLRSDGVKCLATDHDCVLRKYEMKMRQQPVQARMCGVGEKSDRRPVDPTPIIQLKVMDENGEDITPTDPRTRTSLRRPSPGPNGMAFMQNPYYFLFACLVGGDENEDELHVIDDGKTRFLTGTPVSSLYHLKDLDNTDAAFFVFPDLGVRKEGRYKLKLTLFEIVDQEVYYCTTMFTSTFSVYSAKKFPGMSKATDLSKSFAEQGLKIRVRKDPRQPAVRNPKSKRKSDAAESEDDFEQLHHPEQRRQHPPQHPHQAKRSRGASMSYPPSDNEPAGRFYRPSSSHSHGEPPAAYPPYPPQQTPTNGYPHGYHPNYPPTAPHMPPPPPPSAYDPYRTHQAFSPSHPTGPGYPPQYYGSTSGRPSTHPAPGAAGPTGSRHHQSLPPPGYGPPEHPNFQHHHNQYQPSPYYTHPPPSAYPPRTPSYPDSPYGDRESEREPRTSVPWPQDRRDTYPILDTKERERELMYARERELERDRERYMSSSSASRASSHIPLQSQPQPQRSRTREGPKPLSPRSRMSPSRHPNSYGPPSIQPSPTLSTGSNFRPLSSSGRDRERDSLPSPNNNVTLPSLSLATSTPSNLRGGGNRSLQLNGNSSRSNSRPNSSAGLPPIFSSNDRDRERDRDDILSQRSNSNKGSRNASPIISTGVTSSQNQNTPPVNANANRMKLHNIVD
ncbi:uncharacterized protein L201_002296 [Kwoniella dendrophila CBS 6074]|uniref:Velvet domain-containing protein n=1 Tax=Kwoniella dendrophila CBS 6074 TaxID=1295534 RepID=A0AAX4JPW5_9TREE